MKSSYSPPRPSAPIDCKLSSNEGPPPRDLPAMGELITAPELARYPDAQPLQSDLAARFGVDSERVLVTAGGDDLLLRVALARLSPERDALAAAPTFEMIPRHVALAGAHLREVPWSAGPYPIEAMLEALRPGTGVVFLVSPNNPTGLAANEADLRRLAARAREIDALVLLDHAYVELADEDLTAAALEYDNLVVLRTLSKAWGLAGLRVGYALGAPDVIAQIEAAGNPYPVSSASLAIARARLATGAEDVAALIACVRDERSRLRAQLQGHGFDVAESQANFVLARGPRARGLCNALARQGIGVRVFDGRPDLADAVRITCPAAEAVFLRLTRAIDLALEA